MDNDSLIHLQIVFSDDQVCMCTETIPWNNDRLALPFLNTEKACLELGLFKI